jgi:hypothetical protein
VTTTMVNPASEKTLRFLSNLIKDRDIEGFQDTLPEDWQTLWSNVVAGFASCEHAGYDPDLLNMWFEMEELPILAQSDASKFIDALKKLAYKPKESTEPAKPIATEPGIYKVGDKIYKVKFNRAGTNMYASELKLSDYVDEVGKREAYFEYAGGLKKLGITADAKLSYEQAKQFGALYGSCICCGRLLTNELSIALGIGPVCGGRQFGGEFKFHVIDAKLDIGQKLTKSESALVDSMASDG